MKLEIKQPEQPQEPVAKLFLEQVGGDKIVLKYEEEGGMQFGLAYFDGDSHVFHVFLGELKGLGYTLNTD